MLGSGDAMVTLLAALLVVAAPSDVRTYAVDPATSTVAYHVVHPFHRVTGTSSRVEGKAVLFPDGKVIAMVRVPVASFDSGVANRDSNMRDAVEEGRFPFVVFRGRARLDPALAASAGETAIQASMDGELELHGVKRPVVVPLAIQLSRDGTGRARGSFEVSLESFGIERPSLLLVRIHDACRIDLDLALREATGSPGTSRRGGGRGVVAMRRGDPVTSSRPMAIGGDPP